MRNFDGDLNFRMNRFFARTPLRPQPESSAGADTAAQMMTCFPSKNESTWVGILILATPR
jgi:hypothetical protein